jgi:hypothetical protein
VKRAHEIEGLGMIVFDPITNYLGKLKMNAEEDVRTVLTPLAQLAEELGIVVLTVGHNNRRTETSDPLMRIMGAAAFSGVARSVWSFGNDPEVESPYAHVMACTRGKVGSESFKFHTVEVPAYITSSGEDTRVIKVVWDGTSKATAEDVTNPEKRADKGKMKGAANALKEFLRGGKRSANECISHLKIGGFGDISECSTRVRKIAGVDCEQRDRQWWWFLPAAPEMFEKPKGREDGPQF